MKSASTVVFHLDRWHRILCTRGRIGCNDGSWTWARLVMQSFVIPSPWKEYFYIRNIWGGGIHEQLSGFRSIRIINSYEKITMIDFQLTVYLVMNSVVEISCRMAVETFWIANISAFFGSVPQFSSAQISGRSRRINGRTACKIIYTGKWKIRTFQTGFDRGCAQRLFVSKYFRKQSQKILFR